MISYLCALFLIANPSIEQIEELKAKEEKAWVAEQKGEIALLKGEKKRLQEEIRAEKDQLRKISLDILDRKASVRDLFPLQMELQHKIYFLDVIEDEIELVKSRVHKGLFGDLLARKKLALAQ